MLKLNHKGSEIVIYDSIEERPITRHMSFNKFILIESGLGGDLADIDQRISRVSKYISDNDLEKASTEMDNLRRSISFAQESVDIGSIAFSFLIYSLDGKVYSDEMSDNTAMEIATKLKSFDVGFFKTNIDNVKKKIKKNFLFS